MGNSYPRPQEPVSHTPPQDSDRWHSLRDHLQQVARLTAQFAAPLGADRLGYYAGLWHDLGKYNPKFQEYLYHCHQATRRGRDSPAPKSVPHAVYGAKLAKQQLPDKLGCKLAMIIFGHHAGIPDLADMDSKLAGNHRAKTEQAYQAVLREAEKTDIELEPDQDLTDYAPAETDDCYQQEVFWRFLFSCLVDADYLDTEQHFKPTESSQRHLGITIAQLQLTFERAYAQKVLKPLKNPQSPLNCLRAEIYQLCRQAAKQPPGVFRLCVPTGGGKTLSGLRFALDHAVAHGRSRVIFAVPYTSIIEQTVNVYRDLFQAELGPEAVLEHHSAVWQEAPSKNENESVMRGDDRAEDARQAFARARLIAQNWDAPLIVTTTVQLFDSLFANRPSRCRKLHNLINSVIVLDEVQTLPIELLDPILCVLRELVTRYGVTVVLCTATQPALAGQNAYLQGFATDQVRDIVPPELAKAHFQQLQRVNYVVPPKSWSWADLVTDLQNRQANQALIVLNTRRNALDVVAALQGAGWPREALFHLSTLLCGAHRRQVLAQVRDRLRAGLPCLLVATQVVEAGVDIDFPLVYRAEGPLDRVVQAAGRCNREGNLCDQSGEPILGQVVIFSPQEGRLPNGSYETAVGTANRYLQNLQTDRVNQALHDPKTFEQYFQNLYQTVGRDRGQQIQNSRESWSYAEVAEQFSLMKDETVPVVVQYDDRANNLIQKIERSGSLNRGDRDALQPYMVNLRSDEFNQSAHCRREVVPGLWVWEGGYDRQLYGIEINGQPIQYDPADFIP
ncbi:CRISPR-associated helicase Cas3' [Limnothrix redekei]|uniref:CRISPR-associated helicase Cas3 n=1 Tax=Limnothrix redekei LRLZ20PSL1 TaxID=3112953 RepID=A0ABW7C7B7_9CYAN